MNQDIFQGKWKQWRGYAKEKWGKLTDDDLDTINGRLEQLTGLLQERYGYASEQAEREIEAWMKEQAQLLKVRIPVAPAALLLAVQLPAMALTMSCTQPDAALTAKVKTQMAADTTVPAMRIEVDTKNHVVTLTGNLDSEAQKVRALEIARNTGGVVDVVDMISVRESAETGNAPEPSRTIGAVIDDASITAAVKSRLLDDPQVQGLRIDVDTRDGVVYLTGVVRSRAEKKRAVELARETEHVRDVEANLTVTG